MFKFDSEERNQGIKALYEQKAISSVSLMMNQPATDDAIDWIKKQNRFAAGLHFNITEGSPICNPIEIPSLISPETGMFFGKFQVFDRLQNNCIEQSDIERELRAQLDLFQKKVGQKPTHLDGHNHVHILGNSCVVIPRIMKAYGIVRVRIPEEKFQLDSNLEKKDLTFLTFIADAARGAREKYLQHGICSTQNFIGLGFFQKNVSQMISSLKPLSNTDSIEFMVHPGFSQQTGPGDSFSYSKDRELEMERLRDSEWRELLSHFELISWKEIE